jgi:mRNA-degrading endonuclease RelE of RelBE toxin-antitoxin system
MSYIVESSEIFKKQFDELDDKSKRIVYEKIQLIKENPYRNKKVHSKRFSRVFRVRLTIQGKEKRLVYVIIAPKIILACFIDRDKDYKDLEKYLKKI